MRTVFTILLTVLVLSAQQFVFGQRNFGLADLDKICTLTDPQLSPDGQSVLVVVSKPDTLTNKNKTALYRVGVASGESRALTFDRTGVSSPRWSPAGNAIAFLANDPGGKSQVFVLSMSGGEAQKITSSPTGVQQFAWSPDGASFAFVQADELANKKEMEKGYDAFDVYYNSMFITARPSPSHIWLIPAAGGQARRLTSGGWTIPSSGNISWSPDGKQIAFQSNETPYSGELVYTAKIVELATGEVKRLTATPTMPRVLYKERLPHFSPDGQSIIYQKNLENVGYGYDIFLTTPAGGTGVNLTAPLDRCFFRAVWRADSKAVFVVANDFNSTSLWMQPLSGKAQKLRLNNLCIAGAYWYEYNVGRNNAIAFIASAPQSPPELYILDTPESAPRKLTDFHAGLGAIQFGRQETISWKSDGFTPNGILTFPPDFDPAKKYPLVVEPHGGPRSTSKEVFNPSVQLKAARGYIVFQPNYRGSDNMGYRFSEAINGDAGEGPGRDVMRGLAELKKRNYIDTTRIAVTGWSYGGFMTTWLIGNYSGWKCAIAGAAVTDWLAQYTQSDVGSMYRFEFGKGESPYTSKKVMENWIRNSPVTYVSNVKTPTLIISNTGDERVPVSESYAYFRGLQDNGTESAFIAFPIPGHIPTDPVRTKEMYRYILEWLDKYMK